ncbi:hypothetical protein JL722_2147 [Aureococcus anophagefferens]|nr:hypothetical protein JL722_2147 [Aureococcus anophagefferens]
MDLRNRGAESVPLMDTTASPMRPEKDDGLGRSLLARNMPRWTDESRHDRPKELNNAAFSTVQVLNSMIGSGVLSFPYVFANCGWILSILLLGLSAVACYATSIMLLRGQAVGHPKGELSEVIEKTLGVPWRKGLVVDTYAGFMFVVVGLVAAPPCFFREYGELTPISLLSPRSSPSRRRGHGQGHRQGPRHPAGPDSWYAPVTLLGNFVYATSMQRRLRDVRAMEATARPAVKSVVAGAVGCGCSILLVMGLGGVAAIGSDVDSDVLSSLDSKTILVKVLYGARSRPCFYIPNDFIIGRLFFWRSWGVNYLQMPEQRHVFTTFCFVFAPGFIDDCVDDGCASYDGRR